MADYYCHPLWNVSPENYGDISPESLPISCELKKSIAEWAGRYDAILNMDDPVSSGFESEREEELFVNDGYRLAQLLRDELGDDYEIIYNC